MDTFPVFYASATGFLPDRPPDRLSKMKSGNRRFNITFSVRYRASLRPPFVTLMQTEYGQCRTKSHLLQADSRDFFQPVNNRRKNTQKDPLTSVIIRVTKYS